MSEERATYRTSKSPGKLPGGTLLKYTDPGYQEPTFEDVRTLKEISGKTGRELSELVGLKDNRTFRKWTAPPGASQKAQIPYSAWRLLLIELGIVSQ